MIPQVQRVLELLRTLVLEPDEHQEPAPVLHLIFAAVIGVSLAVLTAFIGPDRDAEVNAGIAQEVHQRLQGEGGCIRQGAMHEALHNKPMGCASGTRDVPANALSYPLARTE